MVGEAFELSERLGSPVFLRATTRIDHGYEAVDVADAEEYVRYEPDGFERDPKRWVIFPALSVRNDAAIEQRNARLADELSDYPRSQVIEPVSGTRPRLGIVSHGINWQYVLENVEEGDSVRLMRVATPFPFPERLASIFSTSSTRFSAWRSSTP